MTEEKTNFGYEQLPPEEKSQRVYEVFDTVSGKYDLMNDLMSFGLHRFWKRYVVNLCALRQTYQVLDLAGGTGDISHLVHSKLGDEGAVTVCDINAHMLQYARNRAVDQGIIKGIHYVQADAEKLPFQDNIFDCIIISFGLRNFTDKNAALCSAYRKLKYGSQLMILEFSKVTQPILDKLYASYSFNVIPKLGKVFANSEASYRYLVESIRMHPDQDTLSKMLQDTGFEQVQYFNLAGGIVAIHRAYKL